MNKVMLMGRLTRDPNVTYSQGQNGQLAIARYTLAVDRRVKSGEQTADFISCVAFGKSAEFVEKYLKQGTKIAVAGRIQTGSYTNKDGVKVYTTDVIVEEHYFAESKNTSGSYQNSPNNGYQNNGYQNNNQGGYQQGYPASAATQPSAPGSGFMNIHTHQISPQPYHMFFLTGESRKNLENIKQRKKKIMRVSTKKLRIMPVSDKKEVNRVSIACFFCSPSFISL